MSLSALLGGTFAALAGATVAGQLLRYAAPSETVANINLRIAAWWVLTGSMALALLAGETAVLVLFTAYSVLALREFVALVPGGSSYWWIAGFAPLQYALIWSRWPIAFSAAVPLAALPFVKSYRAVMLCVWGVSHAPALLMLDVPGHSSRALLFYLLIVVESSDVFQFVWGKLLGRRPLAPRISPHKTWEGFLGGVLSATALGAALHGATPFSIPQAAAVCAAMTLAGVAGGLTISGIKRKAGVKDSGTIIPGHGGVLDRIDSLCFAAPVFYYVLRYLIVR